VKQAVIDNLHNTKDLLQEIKVGQNDINSSLDNLFTQLKNIGIEI
jgi:hypothetical protein